MQNELRRAIDAIPGQVWSAGPDGSMDFLNQRWRDYTGMALDEACWEAWQTVLHPDDRAGWHAHWRGLLASGAGGEREVRLRRADGTFRWFLVRSVPLLDDSGILFKWFGQNTDIEDRKQAEALLEGEKRLLEMVAGGRPLAEVLDRLCRIVETTAQGCRCSVVLVDAGGTRLVHGAAPSLPASFSDAIDGRALDADCGPCGMAARHDATVLAPDIAEDSRWRASGWRDLALAHGLRACWSTPIRANSGRVLGAFAVYYDRPATPTPRDDAIIGRFTHLAGIAIERAQDEAALRQSEAFLNEAQRLSLTGSFLWRVDAEEIVWSEQTYRIYELDPSAPATFDLVATRIHPDEALWFQELLARAAREGGDLEFEHRLLMPDGATKYLHVVARARRWLGRLEYIGAVQDVTERRRSEDALSRVRAELARIGRVSTLGALTASIAHEVNQPLSGILTNASTALRMLAADPPNLEGVSETARRTIRDANRASDVIRRLRSLFSRTSRAADRVDLDDAAREVLDILSSELQQSGTAVRLESDEALPPVTGDRVQLQQVILNLVLNAAEAASVVEDRPRLVTIRTAHDVESVHLSVHDSGPGFEPQDIDRLFEAFYSTKDGGMGVGLYISRSIVESHEGRMWALSDGSGATFGFAIPRLAVGRSRPDDPPGAAQSSRHVDDE